MVEYNRVDAKIKRYATEKLKTTIEIKQEWL